MPTICDIISLLLDGTKNFRSRAKLLAYVHSLANESAEKLHNGVEKEEEEEDFEEQDDEEEEGGLTAGASFSDVQQYVAERWHRAEDSSLLGQPAVLQADIRADLAGLRAAAAAEHGEQNSLAADTTMEDEEEEREGMEEERGGMEESILTAEDQKKLGEFRDVKFSACYLNIRQSINHPTVCHSQ